MFEGSADVIPARRLPLWGKSMLYFDGWEYASGSAYGADVRFEYHRSLFSIFLNYDFFNCKGGEIIVTAPSFQVHRWAAYFFPEIYFITPEDGNLRMNDLGSKARPILQALPQWTQWIMSSVEKRGQKSHRICLSYFREPIWKWAAASYYWNSSLSFL